MHNLKERIISGVTDTVISIAKKAAFEAVRDAYITAANIDGPTRELHFAQNSLVLLDTLASMRESLVDAERSQPGLRTFELVEHFITETLARIPSDVIAQAADRLGMPRKDAQALTGFNLPPAPKSDDACAECIACGAALGIDDVFYDGTCRYCKKPSGWKEASNPPARLVCVAAPEEENSLKAGPITEPLHSDEPAFPDPSNDLPHK